MDKKCVDYSSKLLEAYKKNILNVTWRKSGVSLSIDSEQRKLIPEFDDKEFIQYVFEVMKIVKRLVLSNLPIEEDELKLKTAKEILNCEKELVKHIKLKNRSKVNSFNNIEYEIVSYRNNDRPYNVDLNSIILKINSEMEEEQSEVYELSLRDLKEMVSKLSEAVEKLEEINKD